MQDRSETCTEPAFNAGGKGSRCSLDEGSEFDVGFNGIPPLDRGWIHPDGITNK